MTLQFKLIVTLLLLAGVGFLVWEYTRAIEDASTAEHALEEKTNAFNTLQARYDTVDRVLKEKLDDDQLLQERLAQFGRKLDALKINDKAARDWAAVPLPDSVIGVLYAEDQDGVHPTTGRIGVTNPDAKPKAPGSTE